MPGHERANHCLHGKLKRVGRFLCIHPRLVWKYVWQPSYGTIHIYTDSNWAGCKTSRKSTSGGVAMIGDHTIKTWSKTQAAIAKSSAEAELYAVIRGSVEGLGLQTLAKELGFTANVQIHLDASAAKSIIERRGLCRVRHIDVEVLWLQQQAARRLLPLNKIAGPENPGDLPTKHHAAEKMKKHIIRMRMHYTAGRAAIAARLHSVSELKGYQRRRGDYWEAKGSIRRHWSRRHNQWRRSLFTPMHVQEGPNRSGDVGDIRETIGITLSGPESRFRDVWKLYSAQHACLSEPWIGQTIFRQS